MAIITLHRKVKLGEYAKLCMAILFISVALAIELAENQNLLP